MSGCPFPHHLLFPNMPAGWEPPAPAWKCMIADKTRELAVAHFGTQARGEPPGFLDAWFHKAAALPDGPDHVERAAFEDVAGYTNSLYLAYWIDAERFARWQQQPAVDGWWSDDARLREGPGYWRESYRLAPSRFETIWSNPAPHSVGVRILADVEGPMAEHGYWGAARDRLPASREGPLESPLGPELTAIRFADTLGRRLVVMPPENLCVIRSGQDWTDCLGEERATYLDSVQPVLARGMAYLAENPLETGCLSCRLARQADASGALLDQSFGLAHFLTLRHLEDWSRSHPTHLAIFGSFYAMLEKHDFAIALRLYHELFVVPPGAAPFEYLNCHNRTGLLTLAEPAASAEARTDQR